MAEKFIHIKVDAKIPTLADCVRLKVGQSYSATIVQGDDYNGNSGVNLVFNNFCSEAFTVPSIDWFTDTVDGGNFRAYTDSFIIPPNQEKSIPLKFIGTYLSDVTRHVYNLTLNGVSNTFTLTITVPVVNNPPIISNFSKLLENRAEYTFLLSDFNSNYNDIDGNALDGVIISGDTSNFVLQGLPLVSGTEITPTQISSGYLKYVSPNVNAQSQSTVTWYAKDTLGLTSNPATITVTSKSYCVAPTLTSVDKINNNTVTFIWNNNGVEYGSGATISLEVSTDGGTNYTSIMNVSPSASPYTISSGVINSIANGSAVKFRVTSNGSPCNTQNSNVITLTWTKLSEMFISDVVKTETSTCFKLNVVNGNYNGGVALSASITQDGDEYSNNFYVSCDSLTFPITNINATPSNNNLYSTSAMIFTEGIHDICITTNVNQNTDVVTVNSTKYMTFGGIEFLNADFSPIYPSLFENVVIRYNYP